MERGYTRQLHDDPESNRGCICPEDLEHDGQCQNALRGKKDAKCAPCSEGWHFPYPCNTYVSKNFTVHTTQCGRCGWDSASHPLSDDLRAMYAEPRRTNT